MFNVGKKLKVLDSIVCLIAIDMMNNFSRPFQLSSKMLFNYPAMFWNEFSILVNNYVSFSVSSAFSVLSSTHKKWRARGFKTVKVHFTKAKSFVTFFTTFKLTYFKVFHEQYINMETIDCQGA